MAIKETTGPAPDFLDDISRPDISEGLIIYPDRIEVDGDNRVVAFRPDAQALRVVVAEQGVPVVVVAPDDATKGIYTEHAADWVLPLIELPTGVVSGLIAEYLLARLRGWRAGSSDRPSPVVRYREIERSPDGSSRVRQIEGPAEDVIAWLEKKDK